MEACRNSIVKVSSKLRIKCYRLHLQVDETLMDFDVFDVELS